MLKYCDRYSKSAEKLTGLQKTESVNVVGAVAQLVDHDSMNRLRKRPGRVY